LQQNEILNERILQQDNDINDLVEVFKQENDEREQKIRDLTEKLENEKAQAVKEKEILIGEHEAQVADLKNEISEKESNMRLIQQELHVIKDFRVKRLTFFNGRKSDSNCLKN
jgi:chromosome segregation ATPase